MSEPLLGAMASSVSNNSMHEVVARSYLKSCHTTHSVPHTCSTLRSLQDTLLAQRQAQDMHRYHTELQAFVQSKVSFLQTMPCRIGQGCSLQTLYSQNLGKKDKQMPLHMLQIDVLLAKAPCHDIFSVTRGSKTGTLNSMSL